MLLNIQNNLNYRLIVFILIQRKLYSTNQSFGGFNKEGGSSEAIRQTHSPSGAAQWSNTTIQANESDARMPQSFHACRIKCQSKLHRYECNIKTNVIVLVRNILQGPAT